MTETIPPSVLKRCTAATRSSCRIALRLLLAAAALAGGTALVISWRIHSSNASENRAVFRAQPPPEAHQRILIFSPHCDDETLGAGGYINAAVRAGAEVHIVMVTNGDGFELAAALHYRKLRTTPQLLRSFAYARQREAIRAASALGVKKDSVIFLGFPDRGLAELWGSHWSPAHPYFSAFTQTDHNPYSNSLHPGAPYCGARVLSDVEEELTRFKPDIVLAPHPNDDHPDHWATSSFVRAAIDDLARHGKPWAEHIQFQVFVVHHGDWPVPQGFHPHERLSPPYSLARTDTRWSEFPLTSGEEGAKLNAIHRYGSQMAVMSRFLESFVRKTECFGSIPTANLNLRHGQGSGSPVLIEFSPVKDTILRTVERDANIQKIEALQEGSNVCIRVQVRGAASSKVIYTLNLRSIGAGNGPNDEWHATVHGSQVETTIPGAHARVTGSSLYVCMPAADFNQNREWFVSAETQFPYATLDRAGWRELKVQA